MNIAVIPARGGSKRIPRKNIREFCGKPLIAYSIETAHQSDLFDKIIVSTDDDEIAEIAKIYGAEVPFVRPAEISDDYATTSAVISHAVNYYIENDFEVKNACCLYATAPFIEISDLIKAHETLNEQKKTQFVFTATTFPFSIHRAIYLEENGEVKMFQPDKYLTRSQDLKEAYHDAGQFYFGKAQAWLEEKPIFESHSRTVLLPRYRVQDIDIEEDWLRAEFMFKNIKEMK